MIIESPAHNTLMGSPESFMLKKHFLTFYCRNNNLQLVRQQLKVQLFVMYDNCMKSWSSWQGCTSQSDDWIRDWNVLPTVCHVLLHDALIGRLNRQFMTSQLHLSDYQSKASKGFLTLMVTNKNGSLIEGVLHLTE